MAMIRKVACGLAVATIASLLAGCSVDALIWGRDGARVIQATEKLVSDLSFG